jgi:EmrB/QacA subfamily drug resistance transporter
MPEPHVLVAAPPVPSRDRRWWTLSVLCLSLIIVTLDNTILNVALPTLVHDLHASDRQLQWVVDSYVLVFAGLLLTAGSIGDRYGRRGTLTIGLWIFAVGSTLSALAGTAGQLTATRAVMGLGAAFVFPATLSILTNVFTDPAERAKAIAVWAGTAGIGIALGPVAGGFLLEHFYWGSIFLVNLPIVALALVGGRLFVPTSRDPDAGRLDLVGAALSLIGLGSVVYSIIQAPARGWTDGLILGGFALGAAALAAFVAWERSVAEPLLDLSVFRNPRFTASSLAISFVYFCLFGTYFILTQHLQFLLGYSPLKAGLAVVPFAAVLMPVTNLTPRLVRRFGARNVVSTGLVVAALALALRARSTVDTGYGSLLVFAMVFAVGMGLVIAPATASIMGSVPREKAGVGSAINDTTRQVGGALGVALLGSLFSSGYRSALDGNVDATLPASVVEPSRDSIGSALTIARGLPGTDGGGLADAARHAFIHGADVTCWVAAGVALVGALIAFVALPRHQPAPAAAIDPEIDLEAEAADAGLALTPAVYAGDDAA